MSHIKAVPNGSILRNRNFLLIWNVGTLSTIGEMAEMLKIKELAKEDMGVEKYRKSENNRKQTWG